MYQEDKFKMRKLSNEVLKYTKIPKSTLSTITVDKKESLFFKSEEMNIYVGKT